MARHLRMLQRDGLTSIEYRGRFGFLDRGKELSAGGLLVEYR